MMFVLWVEEGDGVDGGILWVLFPDTRCGLFRFEVTLEKPQSVPRQKTRQIKPSLRSLDSLEVYAIIAP